MSHDSPVRVLLGPQSPKHNIAAAMAEVKWPDGPFATITAGFQEAEGDTAELQEVVGRSLEDLRLYHRTEDVFRADKPLADALRARQESLIEQQRSYRKRLKNVAIAARQMLRAKGDAELLAAEQAHAITQLQDLDDHHLARTEALRQPFEATYNERVNEHLAHHYEEIIAVLDRCSAILIAGGNIAVLLNRIRLLGVEKLLADKPIVAWSAGAMVLTGRIVLFHDRSPEGRRDAEVFGSGCGVLNELVLLPDAAHRLRENDRLRLQLMAQRFSPDTCITLDNGSILRLRGDATEQVVHARRLDPSGRIIKLRSS